MARQWKTGTAAALVALALAGCGSSAAEGPGGDDASDGDLRPVKVGAVPVVDVAALYVGIDQGFFAERGLELEIEMAQGGAALVPAVLNGEYDVAYGGVTTLFQALDQNIPIKAVAQGGASTGVQGEDHAGIVVADDSPVHGAADLQDRTIAVNALQGLHELAVRAAVQADGGDHTAVSFAEVPLSDQAAALAAGHVDAVSTSEPFLSTMLDDDTRLVTSPFVDTSDDFVTAMYFTAESMVNDERELITDFVAALEESTRFAAENPEAVRAALPEFTEIDDARIETMVLTRFEVGLDADTIQPLADLAGEFGLVSGDVDAGDLIADLG